MSRSSRTFVDACLQGEAFADEIDNFVDRWHDEDCDCDLADYLGFTAREYAEWVKHPHSLAAILLSRKHGIPLEDTIHRTKGSLALAARGSMTNPEEVSCVVDWLTQTGRSLQ